jgi:hypothetical protein
VVDGDEAAVCLGELVCLDGEVGHSGLLPDQQNIQRLELFCN